MEAREPQIAVMHLVESSGGGAGMFGKERAIFALMRAQRAAGDIAPRLAVFAPCDVAEVAARDGFQVDVLGAAEQTLPLPAVRRLRQLLAGGPPMIVHTHGYKANIIGRAMRAGGARLAALIATCHGFVSNSLNLRTYNALDRLTGGLSDAVTAPDPSMLAHFGPGSHTVFIPNAVADLARPDGDERAAARASFGWPADAFVAGMLGRLSQEKGVANFLGAAELDASARGTGAAPATWAIAGSGPLEPAVQASGLASLRYVGFLEDALPYLSALDVYVQPSFTEGLSISLLEAMRFGLPIVATAVGATREAVRDGVEAILVKPDPRALADAVSALRADTGLRARLGSAARARFYDLFRMEVVERRYAALYRATIARHGFAHAGNGTARGAA